MMRVSVFHMRPYQPAHDAVDGHLGDAIFLREPVAARPSSSVTPSNLTHLFFGQLGVVPLGAGAVPPFGFHVTHVVALGAKKEMVGIDARFIVAPMANAYAGVDWAASYFPGNAVNQLHSAMLSAATDEAIAAVADPSLPNRAAVRGRFSGAPMQSFRNRYSCFHDCDPAHETNKTFSRELYSNR